MTHRYTKRLIDHNTDLAVDDYLSLRQCRHDCWYRDGWRWTQHGYSQKMRCARCGLRRTAGGERVSRETLLREIAVHYKEGLTIKQAVQVSGHAFTTIQKVYKLFRSVSPVYCGCGRMKPHFGWCAFRRKQYPEIAARLGRGKRRENTV